jgi:hypothetical protein
MLLEIGARLALVKRTAALGLGRREYEQELEAGAGAEAAEVMRFGRVQCYPAPAQVVLVLLCQHCHYSRLERIKHDACTLRRLRRI